MYRFGIVACLAAVVFASTVALRYALADFYYQQAKLSYENLEIAELTYSHELKAGFKDIDLSLQWRRDSSDALDFKANLLFQSWWLSPDAQYLDDSALLQEAVNLHYEASALRQGWVFSSARLALIYSQQANLGKQFDHWFAESHRLGLYEARVARSLMVLGLQQWSRLTKKNQALTTEFIQASIEQKSNSPDMISSILDQYQRRQEVCSALQSTPRMIKVCG